MKKYFIAVLAAVLIIGGTVLVTTRKSPPINARPVVQGPTSITVTELGFSIQLPANLRDLTYVIGNGPETEKAAEFSDTRLTDVGGQACAAGNHVGVSGFPLGQVVVSEETPDKVAAEVAGNPDDGIGDFIAKIGDKYLYYTEAPAEPCSQDPQARQLQKDGAAALKQALKAAQPAVKP